VSQLLVIAAYALPYGARARTLARRGTPVPRSRIVCFAAGLALVAVAVSPPLADWATRRLTGHMVEHLLLGDLAPLLVALGLTGPLLAPLLRELRPLRALAHPAPALVLWAVSLYAWHLRAPYDAAVSHPLLHALEHASFFLFGLNLWLALLGPLPKPAWFTNGARLGYVIAMWLVGMMLANAFIWAERPFYRHYPSVTDQSAAGAVMLVEQSVVIVALLGWMLFRVLRDAERRQQLAELAAARGVVLDERRIARAVAADQGKELARRLGS
jgi:putative membrane protein